MSSLSSNSRRFEIGFLEKNQVLANNTGPALFKWRYTPEISDIQSATIECYFEENGFEKSVIRRIGNDTPVVASDVQNTRLRNKVQGYVDSNDSTIFGFIISTVSKSDPKEYRCLAVFNTHRGPTLERSPKLLLQVLGNMQRFCYLSVT